MAKAHGRTDFKYSIIKGKGRFCPAAYACVITQSTAYPDERCLYHIQTFYGHDARKVRAEAMRYGSDICNGRKLPVGYREQYLPSNFPSAGLPKRSDQVEVR